MTDTKPTNARLELITVEKAKQFLEHNTSNRPVNDAHVNNLAAEMMRNNFHVTGEAIKFSIDGDLLDGQHRLLAIVKSGKPQEMFVVRNLSAQSFKYMDTNRTRSASDVLGIEGVNNPKRSCHY